MSGTAELVRKLGVKENSSVAALSASPDILARIREGLPEGAVLMAELPGDTQVNIILVWLTETGDLRQVFQRLRYAITSDGAIWAVISKKRAGRKRTTSVTFGQVQAAALKTDLVDNKVVSLSDEEYGIRFVVRREKRGVRV